MSPRLPFLVGAMCTVQWFGILAHNTKARADEPDQDHAHKLPVASRPLYAEAVKKLQGGDPTAALAVLVRLARDEPQSAWAQVYAAEVAMLMGDHLLAVRYCDRAIGLDERCAQAWHIRAHSHICLERWGEAEVCLTKQLTLDQSNSDVWVARSQCRRRLGRFQGALEDVLDARKRILGSDVILRHVEILCDHFRFEEALAEVDRLTKLYPDFAAGRFGRGVVLTCLGRKNDADLDFAKAVELNVSLREYVVSGRLEAQELAARAKTKIARAPLPRLKR